MSFINTRTSLGEQAALDALVAATITEINEDALHTLETYALYYQNGLVSVNFPNVTRIKSIAFYSVPELQTIDIGKQCVIQGEAFALCPKLRALILRGTTGISTLDGAQFQKTPIGFKLAGIYVPRSLLSDYLANNNWAVYSDVIRAIEDMPVTDFSTITHTWSQIKSMVNNESFFSSDYAVGDYKQFTYGTHTVIAEIAKIDSTNKYVDFIVKNPDETCKCTEYSNYITSYANTILKARLDAIYANELPSDLKAVISPVTKKYHSYDDTVETFNDSIWLLNSNDVNATGNYLKDNEGEAYSIFDTNGKRTKYNQTSCSSVGWWLGSAYNSSQFMFVTANGAVSYSYPSNNYGIVFGFRIKKDT